MEAPRDQVDHPIIDTDRPADGLETDTHEPQAAEERPMALRQATLVEVSSIVPHMDEIVFHMRSGEERFTEVFDRAFLAHQSEQDLVGGVAKAVLHSSICFDGMHHAFVYDRNSDHWASSNGKNNAMILMVAQTLGKDEVEFAEAVYRKFGTHANHGGWPETHHPNQGVRTKALNACMLECLKIAEQAWQTPEAEVGTAKEMYLL